MSDITNEIKKRRTFAIISHPDAGKINADRKVPALRRSDQPGRIREGKMLRQSMRSLTGWKSRKKGVFPLHRLFCSLITADTASIFWTRRDIRIFPEDTYRTLMAADSAVMVIDASKGVEAQTRKLFEMYV